MGKITVLLCEDSEDVILITTFLLESEGFNVEVARNTSEIPPKARDKHPELILMDLELPSIGGEAAISKLRDDSNTKDIPILLLSGRENLESIARKLMADGYIHKPYDAIVLITAINVIIQSKVENNRSS